MRKRNYFLLAASIALLNCGSSEIKNELGQSTETTSEIKNYMSNYELVNSKFGIKTYVKIVGNNWVKTKEQVTFANTLPKKEYQKRLKKYLLSDNSDYQNIMTDCFNEFHRVLKPEKWMTVEFSNTSAAVWNGIQTALQRAGFIIANVASIDKKQGSYNAVTNATSVKQDLVISCYKPSENFENNFKTLQGDIAVWDFVSEHLHHLPEHIKKDNSTTAIVERSPKIIFDRLITFYLMRGLPVPIDARDFQEGLKQKFAERDGMYFTVGTSSRVR